MRYWTNLLSAPQPQLQASKDFWYFLSVLSLTDLYCTINPTSKQYTFYSARHQSFSRIDYILTSSTSLRKYMLLSSLALYQTIALWRPLVHLALLGTPPRAPRWLFNVSLLKNCDFNPNPNPFSQGKINHFSRC